MDHTMSGMEGEVSSKV